MDEFGIAKTKLGSLPDKKMKISDLFLAVSNALDMGDAAVFKHSRRVAYIALELAEDLNLAKKDKENLVLAALIHDIGIISSREKEDAQRNFLVSETMTEAHCKLGAELTQKIRFLPEISDIIYYHHHNWDGGNFDQLSGKNIPLASRIIYLADRIDSLINHKEFIFSQVEDILFKINNRSGSWFDPTLVDSFLKIAKKESFWLNLRTGEYINLLNQWGEDTAANIGLTDLESIASIMAHLIDRISPFTSRHSTGVAAIAAMIADELNYGLDYQRAFRIAGLFHDLGKLIIPSSIIEKKDKLTNKEFQIVKQHTFYTYQLLNKIEGMGSIPEWAAFHHERLDGTGYPFRIAAEKINIGSRIMAVSDVFQALTEDRPYRPAYKISKALEIIDGMEQNLKLDSKIIKVLKNAI